MSETVYNPVELVSDLADQIGIHQPYAIAKDMRGEDTMEDKLKNEIECLKAKLEDDMEYYRARGEVDALRWVIKTYMENVLNIL